MTHSGGCACGAIRFDITAPFLGTGSCHCTDCQRASGGGPNYVALAPRDALTITKGTPKRFASCGGSGSQVSRVFCGECGTPLWSIPAHEPMLPIKIGALDAGHQIAPQLQIYTGSAPDWHRIDPDLPSFAKMPPAA